MKILKKPDHIIFDTKNPSKMEFRDSSKNAICSSHLHQVRTDNKTDHEYLSQYFHPIDLIPHPIFTNFGSSFFFVFDERST
jgi:restriction endonuclease S subunit